MALSPAECLTLLKKLGYSYRRIAKDVGLSSPTICGIASGRQNPSWSIGQKIIKRTEELVRETQNEINAFVERESK